MGAQVKVLARVVYARRIRSRRSYGLLPTSAGIPGIAVLPSQASMEQYKQILGRCMGILKSSFRCELPAGLSIWGPLRSTHTSAAYRRYLHVMFADPRSHSAPDAPYLSCTRTVKQRMTSGRLATQQQPSELLLVGNMVDHSKLNLSLLACAAVPHEILQILQHQAGTNSTDFTAAYRIPSKLTPTSTG